MRALMVVRPAGSRGLAGRARALISAALVLALGVSLLGARTLGSPARGAHRVVAEAPRDVSALGIGSLQQRLHDVPKDWRAWAALGAAYVQQARISGDPSYYPKAEEALRTSIRIEPTSNFEAMTGMGALAAARHDFAAALTWGQRARAINPYSAAVYGVIGDALIELGRYPQAFAALQRMVDLKPGLSSYARVSYAWELQGNIPNAIRALEMARQAASSPRDAAFADYYLGELYWNSGRLSRAATHYEESIARDPTFVPGYQGLAKVAAAHGKLREAIRGYERVVASLPLPQYVIELGDLYMLAGDRVRAREQFALVGVQERLFRANGVNVDVEAALFEADHGIDRAGGLAAASGEWRRRQSVFVADALAWSLYANERYREALSYSKRALRLGTRSALFFFHKGMIERALGLRSAARRDLATAISINPHFSFLWAKRVPSILGALR